MENRALKKKFEPMREQLMGDRRLLHDKTPHDLPLTNHYSGDQIENKMGGVCSTYGVEEKSIEGFGAGNLREGDYLEDLGIDGRMHIQGIG
jgi:hypothetical protein